MSENNIGISLGWNCHSAMYGVHVGIRGEKKFGYKTCPFDEMITNYPGLIQCLKDDFKHLYDVNYLKILKIPSNSQWLNTNGDGDELIYNTKYKFIFNHESPGHANLHVSQNWEHGKNHYCIDNFKYFIMRYETRVQNFTEYVNNNNNVVTFILTRYNTKPDDVTELNNLIRIKYPNLKYNFVLLDYNKNILYDHHLLMGFDKDDDEVKRLL